MRTVFFVLVWLKYGADYIIGQQENAHEFFVDDDDEYAEHVRGTTFRCSAEHTAGATLFDARWSTPVDMVADLRAVAEGLVASGAADFPGWESVAHVVGFLQEASNQSSVAGKPLADFLRGIGIAGPKLSLRLEDPEQAIDLLTEEVSNYIFRGADRSSSGSGASAYLLLAGPPRRAYWFMLLSCYIG